MKTNPLLLLDFYKTTHAEQYPENLTKIVSYFTPRSSRIKEEDKIIFFGLQGFIKDYLIEYFSENFFQRNLEEVLDEYKRILDNTMGVGSYGLDKIRRLHKLGYLPLEIRALEEGSLVDIGVPLFEITNTHPDFAWVVNTIETMLSATLWHIMTSAKVGYNYRKVVNQYYKESVDDNVRPVFAMGDFSMRGQESIEGAMHSSAAFLLSFLNTATVPAIIWLEKNYGVKLGLDDIGYGALSTEHSVMCSHYAIEGEEQAFLKKLLTETYPEKNFSVVADSYDYWDYVCNILPTVKEEILNRKSRLSVRGDSGDPIEIVAGKKALVFPKEEYLSIKNDPNLYCNQMILSKLRKENLSEDGEKIIITNEDLTDGFVIYAEKRSYVDKIGLSNAFLSGARAPRDYFEIDYLIFKLSSELKPEDKGTVWCLWEIFGGQINTKNYKVLPTQIRAAYGDGITLHRAKEIYARLNKKGFSAENVFLASGSLSMQGYFEDGHLSPFTRDSYGIAIKSTYIETEDGNKYHIFKDPKTDSENLKKSQRGCCKVVKTESGFTYKDGFNWSETLDNNELRTVFKNGKMVKENNLKEIRNRLWAEY